MNGHFVINVEEVKLKEHFNLNRWNLNDIIINYYIIISMHTFTHDICLRNSVVDTSAVHTQGARMLLLIWFNVGFRMFLLIWFNIRFMC